MNPFISNFPSELLLLIFESTCKDHRIELQSRRLSRIPALSLSHVCRSFRSLATSSCGLWSNVTIDMGKDFPHSSTDSETRENQLIMIEKNLLPIFYKCLDGHPVRMTLMAYMGWKPSGEFRYLFPASWTISSLAMTEDIYAYIIDNNIHLDEHITSLQIINTIYGNSWSSFFPRGDFSHLCNLEDVDMGPFDFGRFDLPWHQLRVVRAPADLVSLTPLASRCTRLESLSLYKTDDKYYLNLPNEIAFQSLTELRLWLFYDFPELITRLHAPSLTTLIVTGDKNYPTVSPTAYNGILNFLEWSSPAIQTFKLQSAHCSVAELINLLGRMPHLRYLHFKPPLVLGKGNRPTKFHDLETFFADSLNLPELIHLEVHGLPDSSSTNSLVRSIKHRKSVEGDMLRVVWLWVTRNFVLDETLERLSYEMNHSSFSLMIETEEEKRGELGLWWQTYISCSQSD